MLVLAQNTTMNIVVPLNNANGNGTCSPGPVTGMEYTVTASSPGLQAVLACNQPAYDALKNADLTQPQSANLPAPLLDMSCTAPNTTTCTKQMPMNRQLRSQVMCILLKGATPANGQTGKTVTATVTVTWMTGSQTSATGTSSHISVNKALTAFAGLIAFLLIVA